MVFFFTSSYEGVDFTLYMGRDKFENEELIKFGWDIDVWFHVDDLSSAHVYLRLPPGVTIKTIPAAVLEDCAQLVKANSIEGNKKQTGKVRIVYTPWSNLHKTGAMATGQIGFHDNRQLMYTDVEKRENVIVNRLNKTRVEKDSKVIKESKDAYDAECRRREKDQKRAAAEQLQRDKERHQKEKEEKSYDKLFTEENMTSNAEMGVSNAEDDFM